MKQHFDFDELLKAPQLRSGIVDVEGFEKPLKLYEMSHAESSAMLKEAREVKISSDEEKIHLAKYAAKVMTGEFQPNDKLIALAENVSTEQLNNTIVAAQQMKFIREDVEKNS